MISRNGRRFFIRPDGSPVLGSLTMKPFGGSACAFVIFASASAFELTHTLWPSKQRITAGRSETAASSCARVGMLPGKGAVVPTGAFNPGALRMGFGERSDAILELFDGPGALEPDVFERHSARQMCVWISLKPGSTAPPWASTTWVLGPRSRDRSPRNSRA